MLVHKGIKSFNPTKKVVLTPGTFDGLHKGHATLLAKLNSFDKEIYETVLLTFSPHPRKIIFPDSNQLKLLNTLEEKIELFKPTGIDHLIVYPFTQDFSRMNALSYVRDFLIKDLKVDTLVIGYDHHFGKNREGDIHFLNDIKTVYNLNVSEIPPHEINEINVSSTKIRKALMDEGAVKLANNYLGYPFRLSGKVIEGKKLGRTIGFHTANLKVDPDKLIPKNGAYVVRVKVDHTIYDGMLNIGNNPTVSDDLAQSIEVHLFDFNGDLYGKQLQVSFLDFLRDEIKFDGISALKEQLITDRSRAVRMLGYEEE